MYVLFFFLSVHKLLGQLSKPKHSLDTQTGLNKQFLHIHVIANIYNLKF